MLLSFERTDTSCKDFLVDYHNIVMFHNNGYGKTVVHTTSNATTIEIKEKTSDLFDTLAFLNRNPRKFISLLIQDIQRRLSVFADYEHINYIAAKDDNKHQLWLNSVATRYFVLLEGPKSVAAHINAVDAGRAFLQLTPSPSLHSDVDTFFINKRNIISIQSCSDGTVLTFRNGMAITVTEPVPDIKFLWERGNIR